MEETIKIKTFNNVDQLSQYFADELVKGIGETPDGGHYSVALSGGSTPRAIFQYLAANVKDTVDWKKLLIFWGDERCVAPDHKDSNFKMASESLLNHVAIPKENIFRIKGEDKPSDEANRYSEVIKKQVRSHEGNPRFDLILLGLGTDGHTASIFPGSEHLFEHDELCAEVQHPETLQTRITITGKVINHAQNVVFLVTGESKADKVAAIIEHQEGWKQFPASKVLPDNGKLTWFLDDAAASNLKKKL